jgi:ion channel
MMASATIGVVIALLSGVALAVTGYAHGWGTGVIGALIVLFAPVAITRRLLAQERITVATIWGALCLYLLAGLFFALVYAAADGLNGQQFFAERTARDATNYVYFSFVTLATLGYGDLTPAGRLGKLLAASEAVGGQLYLVTIVAVLVSNIGLSRGRRRADPG